uniref:SWIM-type domain-containing protein n=1 Tax=Arundo donax TaxID=35708 RepID=A0A0A9DIY1_ARUDO
MRLRKKTKQCAVKLKFRWPIEAHAASLYTWAAYELFLEELTKSTAYVVVDTKDPWVYNVVHVEHERRERWSKVEFKVCVDQEASHYHCECGLYTHFGIPCCHSLLVMVQKGVREIPPVHIMRRWTRDISIADESGHMLPHGRSTGAMKSKFFKDNLLENTAREVINLANTDGECFEMAMKQLVSLMKKLQKQKEAIRTNCHVGYQSSGSEFEDHGGRTSGSEMFSDSEGRPLQIIDRRSGEAININSLKPPLIRRNIG